MIMPFGIPSEDFHGGFGIPEDEEYESAAEEAHDNLVRSLVEAGLKICEARELLTRSLEQLYILGYDSGFTNSAIDTLTTDIKKFLEDTE
jgi:hypothetical protein